MRKNFLILPLRIARFSIIDMGILDEGKFREGAREYRAQTQRDIVITLCANALSLFCH